MSDYEDQVKKLHRLITGSDELGEYDDPVMRRMLEALDISWKLLDAAGLSKQAPTIAADQGGPWAQGGPATLLDDTIEQVTSRYRLNSSARWRSLTEASAQLGSNLRLLAAARNKNGDPVLSPTTTTPAPKIPEPQQIGTGRARGWPRALWVGRTGDSNTAGKDDSTTYGNVQRQGKDSNIVNSPRAAKIPVVDHRILGRALVLSLEQGQIRAEVQADSDADSGWTDGVERWCGVDIVLDQSFPVAQTRDRWNIVSQVHQASGSGSPPLEFDVHSNALWIRGASTGFNRKVCDVRVNELIRLVFGLRVSSRPGQSVVNVIVNDAHLIENYQPPIDFGPPCYWKVASAYASGALPRPIVSYQANHRIGRSYEDVA